ncbi:MAG: aldo/keto reductase [Alphaproteobacteria bacterium CG_4_10_14_0_8_um_filter_53_9]|nr:MAG: aldo/keto reductase [Alphaproteobacteria bacterium CG_4_10_14_0_8_um_filter_53_9]
MQKVKLGTSHFDVTRLCLGTMTWGSSQNTQEDGFAQMDAALDYGINFFDTAELYAVPPTAETCGKTEEIIGNWFAARPGARDKIVLASKIAGKGLPWIREGAPISAGTLREALEGNLRRLQTDRIDLYQLHWPNRPYPHHQKHWAFEATADAAQEKEDMAAIVREMGELMKEGKIGAWGLSNDTPWGLMTYCRLAGELGVAKPASVQNEYSLLYRLDEPNLSEAMTYENVAYLPYSALAMGILTGKYQNGARPEGSRFHLAGNSTVHRINDKSLAATEEYIKLAAEASMTPSQLALAFTLTRPFVTSTILGATSMAQLTEDMKAGELTLSSDVLAEIERIRQAYQMAW